MTTKKPKFEKSPTGRTFHKFSKPQKPLEPKKTIDSNSIVLSLMSSRYHSFSAEQLKPLFDFIRKGKNVRLVVDDTSSFVDEVELELSFRSEEPIPNPSYEEQLEKYNADYEVYKAEMKWWRKCKKELGEYLKIKKLEDEKKQYEKLKKKFEDD